MTDTTTIYVIRDGRDVIDATTDTAGAERLSRAGYRVTAITRPDR